MWMGLKMDKVDWVVINSERGGYECRRCGAFDKMSDLTTSGMLEAFYNAFLKEHKHCKIKNEEVK